MIKPRAYDEKRGVLGVDSSVFSVHLETHCCYKRSCRREEECQGGNSKHLWNHTTGYLSLERKYKETGWYPGKIRLATMSEKASRALPIQETDTTLLLQDGKFYLCVVVEDKLSTLPTEQRGSIVAIDPGVRTFLTCYDLDGNCFTLGRKEDMQKVNRTDEARKHILKYR